MYHPDLDKKKGQTTIQGDSLQINEISWEKSEEIDLHAGFENIGLGFTYDLFDIEISGARNSSQPGIVGLSVLDKKIKSVAATDQASHEIISLYSFLFNPETISKIIYRFNEFDSAETRPLDSDPVSPRSFEHIHAFDYHTSILITNYLNNIKSLYKEKKSSLRDRLIDLKTESICITILRSNLSQFLESNLQNYDTKSPFSFLLNTINNQLHLNKTIKELSSQCGVSEPGIYRYFQKNYGVSPNRYIWNKKISKAKKLLTTSLDLNIAEVGYAIGINRPAYFTKVFKNMTGLTPSDYRHHIISRQKDKG